MADKTKNIAKEPKNAVHQNSILSMGVLLVKLLTTYSGDGAQRRAESKVV